MSGKRLEDQIRDYTEAWYSEASSIQQLASPAQTDEQLFPGQVTVTVPRTGSQTGQWKGVAVALGAALVVLLIALPILLTRGQDQTEPPATIPPAVPTTSATPDNLFLGVWTGEDSDGSWNTLIVDEDTATYQETGLTACKFAFDQYVGGQAAGPATVEGNTLTFTGTLYCNLEEGRTPHPAYEEFEWVFNYDPGTGIIMLGDDPNATLSR